MGATIVAFDGSEHSYKALDKGIAVTHDDDEVIILYVIPEALIEEFKGFDPDVSRAKAHELVNKAVEYVKVREKRVVGIVKEGNVAETIIDFASKLEDSLIVIGSKGISKIGRFALGSIADKVSRHADRPVMIVR